MEFRGGSDSIVHFMMVKDKFQFQIHCFPLHLSNLILLCVKFISVLRDCKRVCLVCLSELNFPDIQHWLFSHEIGI
jgi:hypothetical protein